MSLPVGETENLLWDHNSDGAGTPTLTAEQSDALKEELTKTEDEIETLKKVSLYE